MRLLVRGLLSRGHGRRTRKTRAAAICCNHCCENHQQLVTETTTKDDSFSEENCLGVVKRDSVDGISGLEEHLDDLKLKDDFISEGNGSAAPMMDWADVKIGVKKSLLEPETKIVYIREPRLGDLRGRIAVQAAGGSRFALEVGARAGHLQRSAFKFDGNIKFSQRLIFEGRNQEFSAFKGETSFSEESSCSSLGWENYFDDGMSAGQPVSEPKRKLYGVKMRKDKWKYPKKGLGYEGFCEATAVDAITFMDDVLGAGCGRKLYYPLIIQSNYFCCRLSKRERQLLEEHDEVVSVKRRSARIRY